MSRPDAEVQIQFLQQIQRLFTEGEFSATYKFALILSLAELSVELGDDSGSELDIPLIAISEKFAELYWRQLAEYSSGQPHTRTSILIQNNGTQAAVVRHLLEIHDKSLGRLSTARKDPLWCKNINTIAGVVKQMPLQYLQIIGGKLEPFLYDYPLPHRALAVRLKAGVAFNLRRYQGLVQQLARVGWVEHIRQNRLNAPMLGQMDDLETFMFGSARSSLTEVAQVLAPIQNHRCFYCNERLDSRAEVDHFIPWVRYPRDTAHNFVLAHRSCNNDKRDMLAAKVHIEHWMDRIQSIGGELGEILAEKGFVSDLDCSIRVASWAYQQSIDAGGLGWVAKGQSEKLQKDHLLSFQ